MVDQGPAPWVDPYTVKLFQNRFLKNIISSEKCSKDIHQGGGG